jgi:hypothetical protein
VIRFLRLYEFRLSIVDAYEYEARAYSRVMLMAICGVWRLESVAASLLLTQLVHIPAACGKVDGPLLGP